MRYGTGRARWRCYYSGFQIGLNHRQIYAHGQKRVFQLWMLLEWKGRLRSHFLARFRVKRPVINGHTVTGFIEARPVEDAIRRRFIEDRFREALRLGVICSMSNSTGDAEIVRAPGRKIEKAQFTG